MIREIVRAICPTPLKEVIKATILRFSLGSYRFRLSISAVHRPHYAHLIFNAAQLASRLGYSKISVIEYGVAGGNGLISLEDHACEVEKLFPVKIEIYGFDTGKGLPAPKDYRDLPYHWKEGFFQIEEEKLRRKLKRAKLVLGEIEKTSKTFFEDYEPAPIGAIVHDFDFYSSTAAALRMLNADEKFFLPRVFCYFDDTIGDEIPLYNDFTGQRLAINEFNRETEAIKLCIPYYFMLGKYPPRPWHHQIWICHFFKHSKYNTFVSLENQQLKLHET